MAKRNPIEQSKYINSEYKRYLKSSFSFGFESLQKLFEKQLQDEDLFKGPYVDLIMPFRRGKSLQQLIDEGVVCRSFKKLSGLNFDRPLYAHQEDALRLIGSGRSAVVTTGTGSGKTECFLFPILNDLLKDVEKGNNEVGVRAIFLYPMNALVNDQIERVRSMLSNCSDITYGFFTGDTPEKVKLNYRSDYALKTGVVIPENELVSREEIRNKPPHLLFTNYSMLEYLLIRPNDYSVISSDHLKHWKYVVMDEAHTYHGSLGIELSMLMRRLTGLTDKKPRFILTSATLGEKGKSENDIVSFAQSLTSAGFSVDDIIFSKRIPMQKNDEYRVLGEDYIRIKRNISEVSEVRNIVQKYTITNAITVPELLYDLLSKDSNVFSVYNILKDKSTTFSKVRERLQGNLDESQLVVLIDLINMTEKDGIGLFDLKYHSFVRPIAGAYINLGKERKLTLTKTNILDGLKAFEIGNCRYCSTPYIIGKVQHNEVDDIDYLFQNNEIDIYENYGDNENVKLDYFLMDDTFDKDNIEQNSIEDNILCTKCGAIHPVNHANATKCTCGSQYLVHVYKVIHHETNGPKAYNNITECPCCSHTNNSGVVKSLNMGKDEGTALISQMLYEAIDEGEITSQKKAKVTFGKKANKDQAVFNEPKVKQFLAFSDSRQQASFAATFMDVNHIRMLRKRLIWKVIENHAYQEVSIDVLVSEIASIIKNYSLFANELNNEKNAWVAVLVDLLRVDGVYDGEGLGLYYFDLNLDELLKDTPDDEIREVLKDDFAITNIGKDELISLMQVVLGTFKTVPAINSSNSTLTNQEKRDSLNYRSFDNYVELKSSEGKKNVHSFLPIGKGTNKVVRYTMKACNCDADTAKELLIMLFGLLEQYSDGNDDDPILVRGNAIGQYQIPAGQYRLRNYINNKFYACNKCGTLTPYNVNDVCVQDGCDGRLEVINPDEKLKLNYYRDKYKTKKIERVVIKEHTAQLTRDEAKIYQNDFKNKKINILSCSTTFEMGIDIGDLETVFMRNVPPSPANYVQRAGRAGRRKDSSAYILTYCSNGSHDYTFFNEPTKMISGIINPPKFDVLNKKIIVRHLMAASLGYFFRDNQSYYQTIEGLAFQGGDKEFYNYLKNNPRDLNDYINNKVLPEKLYEEYHDFNWFHEMGDIDEKMALFVDNVQSLAEDYKKAKETALKQEKYKDADYYQSQIESLKKEKVLDDLSRYCVIPKYGFPVDLVQLQVYDERGVAVTTYDLNRDLKIAISEYAPDSEVIVNKQKFTSRYVSLPKVHQFPKRYYYECKCCENINDYVSNDTDGKCRYCDSEIPKKLNEYYIKPIYGFKTGENKQSMHLKPKRSYSGEVSYIGEGNKDGNQLNIHNVISVETSSNDNLLVMNRSKFYVCPVCGYSEISKTNVELPQMQKKHKKYNSYDCDNEILQGLHLAHKFKTDVAKLTIPALQAGERGSKGKALSFMYAFLEGISLALEIERDDINGILFLDYKNSRYDILVYDDVPGGAGHVKRLVDKNAIISSLKAALEKVSQNCCDENTSCYNCLRNYYNQRQHNKLRRIYAKEIIKELLAQCVD